MRKIILMMIVISVLLFNCDKTSGSLSNDLTGTWELTKSYGGWVGTQAYSPGNGNTITFTTTTYTRQFNDTDTSFAVSGDYIIHDGKPCADSIQMSIINFDIKTASDLGQVISITNGILTIQTPPCYVDGGGSSFRKIAN